MDSVVRPYCANWVDRSSVKSKIILERLRSKLRFHTFGIEDIVVQIVVSDRWWRFLNEIFIRRSILLMIGTIDRGFGEWWSAILQCFRLELLFQISMDQLWWRLEHIGDWHKNKRKSNDIQYLQWYRVLSLFREDLSSQVEHLHIVLNNSGDLLDWFHDFEIDEGLSLRLFHN